MTNIFGRDLHAEVAARHHDAVGGGEDLVELVEALVRFRVRVELGWGERQGWGVADGRQPGWVCGGGTRGGCTWIVSLLPFLLLIMLLITLLIMPLRCKWRVQ